MLELSPLLTAAKPSARSIPARASTSRSKPIPVTRSPLKDGRSLRNASGSRSMTATVLPRSSRMWASVEPTRPQPMITICTTRPFTVRCRVGRPTGRLAKVMPSHGIMRLHKKENLMPGVVPAAQGRQKRPGAVGGIAPRSALAGPETAPREPGDQAAEAVAAGSAQREDAPFTVGQDVEVTIEDVAQGGWCVARPAGQPVMFVRHALPGERVVARVTEVTAKFARADAVEILQESQDRVKAPCPHARPGGCGGCDWQHATLPAQRSLKASVVAQQLRRLAGIDREVTVEPLPGDAATATSGRPGLGWRPRFQFAVDRDGVAGLRGHRSHRVIDIGDCLIAHQGVRDLDIPGDEWSGAAAVEAAVGGADSTENFAVTVIEDGGRKQKPSTRNNKSRPNGSGRLPNAKRTLVEGRAYLAERAAGRLWQGGADGFWQGHPAAADTPHPAVVEAP